MNTFDPRDPENQWWAVIESKGALHKKEARTAARAGRKAAAIGLYIGPRDALEMAWRAMCRAKFGSYLPE